MSVSPQRKDAARNREAILDAARELMARSADFPLYEVARRAGVGQATLYRHFPDRATLAATIARELHEEIGAAVAEHAGARTRSTACWTSSSRARSARTA